MNAICLMPARGAAPPAPDQDASLRAGAEEICSQLCGVVTGDFSFRVRIRSVDETAQKLAMLSNFVLSAAQRAVDDAEARAAEMRDAHRVARIGCWRRNLLDGTLTLSPELHALFGTDPSDKPDHRHILARVHPDDRAATAAALQSASEGAVGEHGWRMIRADGGIARFWAETRLERDASGRAVAIRGVCQDVTERHAANERIYRLAHHDMLTGLVNRTLLHERLDKVVSQPDHPGLAVLCLDLDGFKAVNDLHGHAMGDQVLREAAARLKRNVREGDIVARLGGDEFVVVQDCPAQPDAAHALADRLVAVLAEPYDLGLPGVQADITASVGVALFPSDGHDTETLLHNADTALYQAKWAGKNGSAFFRLDMDQELRERRAMEQDLRYAAERGEFRLAWQPLSAPGGSVTGFEVLLRWHHPQQGQVSPAVFIPLAEGSGSITAIGGWVLAEACAEAARWSVPLRVAVNVSPLQVQGGDAFAEMVERVLAETGLDPARLELEVTEGVLIRDAPKVLHTLRRLKALGVRVALDDFGTGYSSLATLRAFPFDKLKIDQSFVRGVAGGGQDAAIVRAVLGLARGLHLPVVAEGVETEEQLQALSSAGCQEVQGWLVGRPAAIGTFASLLGAAPG